MPQIKVDLTDDQLQLLSQMAEVQGRSLTALVQQALDQFIIHPFSQEEWLEEFRQYVDRIRADLPEDASPQALEQDIAAASDEERQLRLAARRH